MLEMKHVEICVEEKKIIKDLSLTIQDGEIHAIMGPNGVGKSTLCKALMKSPGYTFTGGTCKLNGEDMTQLSTTDISRRKVFYISQNPPAIEGVTNAEMLRMALTVNGEKIDIFAFNKKCNEICARIHLPKSFVHRAINDGMSGGERKKNELFHMWMLNPSFLILDEIDSGLDVDALKTVASSIMDYYKEYHPSILIITHHTQLLDIIKPDFVHILHDGKIIKTGTAELATIIEKNGYEETIGTKKLSEEEKDEYNENR